MIVVTTPTGQIGSQVVRKLLSADEAVRVIARDPTRIAPEIRVKIEIVQGSSDDEDVLQRALDGAESLFLVVPPSFATTDITEYYLRFARPACRAVQAPEYSGSWLYPPWAEAFPSMADLSQTPSQRTRKLSEPGLIFALYGVPASWKTCSGSWIHSGVRACSFSLRVPM